MGAMATLVVAMNDFGWNMLTLRVKHGTHKLNRHDLLEAVQNRRFFQHSEPTALAAGIWKSRVKTKWHPTLARSAQVLKPLLICTNPPSQVVFRFRIGTVFHSSHVRNAARGETNL